MKKETFEKAVEIQEYLGYLEGLVDLRDSGLYKEGLDTHFKAESVMSIIFEDSSGNALPPINVQKLLTEEEKEEIMGYIERTYRIITHPTRLDSRIKSLEVEFDAL